MGRARRHAIIFRVVALCASPTWLAIPRRGSVCAVSGHCEYIDLDGTDMPGPFPFSEGASDYFSATGACSTAIGTSN
jgi:hypothetical protein